jgi:phosphatidylserine decarboxylase
VTEENRRVRDWHPFSAWREGLLLYLPSLLLGTVLLSTVSVSAIWATIGGLSFAFGLFSLFFFRDPHRVIPSDENVLVSPADGKVVLVDEPADSPHYDGPCKRVAIFLSLVDVHVNRAPFEGTVLSTTHQPGGYLNAATREAGERNEAMTIRMETERGPMTVRQVAGLVARRIVCPVSPGETLLKGERFGMIKFGSRTELYLPLDTEICVTVGEKVRGGSSIVARFKSE